MIQISAIAFLVLGVFGSRYLRDRAFYNLSGADQLQLIGAFRRTRSSQYIVTAFTVFTVLALLSVPKIRGFAIPAIFLAYITYGFVSSVLMLRKVRALSLPPKYVKHFRLSQLIQYGGAFIFFVLFVVYPFVSKQLVIDGCLDSGGKFDYKTEQCHH